MAVKNINQLPGDLNAMLQKAKDFITRSLPEIIKVENLNHIEESFDNQGFTDKSLSKWAPRLTPKGKKAQAQSVGRNILVGHSSLTKGTHLKDSFMGTATGKQVVISTDKEYAQVHNEGGRAGRGKGFNMTPRPFLGTSEQLDKKIEAKIDKEMEKVFNPNM